ncbi:MAG: M24 family metallopeptidase [Bacillota bacterium]
MTKGKRKHKPVFQEKEYKARVKKTKKMMEEAGIEVLFASHPANMNYLTGYDGWSFYVHQGVIVSLDKEEPMWVGRGMDANAARVTTYLDDDNIRQYADDYVHSPIGKHPMQFVADIFREKNWENKNIGVEMDQFYFTHKNYQVLAEEMPNAEFTDATFLVAKARRIKSAAEIEMMNRAGKIAEKVMNTALDVVDVGVRECDAAAKISQAQISGTKEFGGDYPAIVPLMPAGEGTNTPHLTWTDTEYSDDEAVILELSGCYHKYHAPIARTLYLGEPDKKLQETADIVIKGLEETLDFIQPGVTCEEVEAKWREAISGSHVVKESRLGYAFGLNYPPDWGEQTASMRPNDTTVLKENMTFHVIPGIWFDDYGFEISEAIQITDKGCRSFYDYPRKLFIK